MIYRINLYRVEHPKGGSYTKKLLGTTYLTEHSSSFGDLAWNAAHKLGVTSANFFSADGLESCPERECGIPPHWQNRPGRWEPVCAGTIP